MPALVTAALLLLGTAWLVGNPPGAAPDELAHYLKALAAGRGELYLGRKPPMPPDAESLPAPQRWHLTTGRLVRVPAGLDPVPLSCTAFRPEVSAGCLDEPRLRVPTESATVVGPYQPFTYVLPGLFMRLAADPESATRLGRLGFWLVSAVLLGLAAFLLWSPSSGGWSLVGLMVATAPMVLFMVSVLSANGLEIAAGLCFGAALIRLARGGDAPTWVWAAAGASGTALALARVTGVLWVGLTPLAVVALIGAGPAVAVVKRGGRRALAAAATVGTAVFASLAWELLVQPRARRSFGAAVQGLPREFNDLPHIFEQAVGIFGWLDTRLPRAALWAWTTLLLALIVLALCVSRQRQRVAVGGLVAVSLAVTVALATLNRATGFGMQARYVLPFVTVVPLVAGEVLAASRRRLATVSAPLLVPLFGATVAIVHGVAWYTNARRHAVGRAGPRWFVAHAEWSPPLGWALWLTVTLVAAGLLVIAAVLARRAPSVSRPAAPPAS